MFRPDRNAARAAAGCERLLMPKMSHEVFLDGVFECVKANSHYIPPAGQGSLYVRPLVIGTGASLGVGASPWYHYVVYCSPVGSYFKGGAAADGINLEVSETYHRASPMGVGNTKSITNYAPAFEAQKAAKSRGFADALFLDTTNQYVEEAGAANVFVLDKEGVVRTPGLGSILPGVTRESVIALSKDLGLEVREGPLGIEEVMEAREAWCTGTAAVITPVGSVTYKGRKHSFDASSPLSRKIYDTFQAIINGTIPDKNGWLVNPWTGKKP
jgi:branched-chain amino acid aminotransferase